MRRAAALAGIVLCSWIVLHAEEPPKDAVFYARQAAQAYKQKDYAASWTAFGRALELAPGTLSLIYNKAAAGALAGQRDDALAGLETLASMQLAYDLAADEDFASLRQEPRFLKVVEAMKALATPRGGGERAFGLAEPAFIPEGIAHDPVTGDFFVGSVRRRAIARVSAAGAESVFVPEARDGIGSILGMAVDAKRRVLHACTTMLPNMTGGRATEPARGAVLTFDLKDGRLVSRREIAAGAEGHDCNDLTVSAEGEIFVSDSRKGAILHAAPGAAGLDVFLPEGTFRSPQGLAVPPGAHHMYVADYGRGLFRVDLASRTVSEVPVPRDVTARGVDGLVWNDGSLIAIQNGVNPHRVTRFVLDPAGARVMRHEILGMSHPSYDEPTLGVIAGGALHYVANSQWGKFGPDGTTLPEGLTPPVILRLPLTAR